MQSSPVAFLSYVRDDDAHEGGRLSQFNERLAGEVKMQTGETFQIFQDRTHITWGQQWQARIDNSLDATTFLIPVLTPSFFKSEKCREELERFLEREEQLGRGDLILPVYYVECAVLSDLEKRAKDPLATLLATRQHIDWRELRFEPFTTPLAGKTLARMAQQVAEALERSTPATAAPTTRKKDKEVADSASPAKPQRGIESDTQIEAQSASAPEGPAAKTEPHTIVVDALHRGDYSTVTAALKAAKPGSRILVRPGLYKEGLVIDKPIEIIGEGELGEVIIEGADKNAIHFKSTMGRVVNICLRQLQVGDLDRACVNIAQGRLDLEDCDITSQSIACVVIHSSADPRLRRNRIHNGKESGIFVYENGQGTLEDNDIFANNHNGITISEGGNPVVRRNRIHDGKQAGVHVKTNGQGTLEDNDISANGNAGIAISAGGNPMVRRNRIHNGKYSGVHVYENGQGTLEDNDIFANNSAGIEIKEGGNPLVRHNRIKENGYEAVWIYRGGAGTIEDNDLTGNKRGAFDIAEDCKANVKVSGNKES